MHLIRVRISDIHSGLGADMAYHGGQRLDVHAVFNRHGGEGVAQVVEAHLLQGWSGSGGRGRRGGAVAPR